FIVLGDIEGRASGPLFDGELYRARYPDVAEIGMPPLCHYLAHGKTEGRQPPSDRRPAPGAAKVTRSMEVGLPLPVDAEAVQRNYDVVRDRLDRARKRRREALSVPRPHMHTAKPLAAALAGLEFP